MKTSRPKGARKAVRMTRSTCSMSLSTVRPKTSMPTISKKASNCCRAGFESSRPKVYTTEHQGEDLIVRQGVGEDGGRCHEHHGGKRQADGENRPQQPPVQLGEERAQEQAEGRNRQVERQVLQLDQQAPVEVRRQLHEVALVGCEQPRGHQEAADAEVERRPELSADDEKAQVIGGHDGDAAEDEEVKLAFQRMRSADLRFRSQADEVPQPAPAVMEIGHLQQNVRRDRTPAEKAPPSGTGRGWLSQPLCRQNRPTSQASDRGSRHRRWRFPGFPAPAVPWGGATARSGDRWRIPARAVSGHPAGSHSRIPGTGMYPGLAGAGACAKAAGNRCRCQ